MDLNFQNFESVNSTNEQSGPFGGNIGDKSNLVGGSAAAPAGSVFDDNQSTTSTRRSNLFSFEYYQQFFDVETDQVVKRLLNSVVPTHKNYIEDFLQPIPDLWGPFWVSVTLVFAIGIFGNLAQFVENDGATGNYNSDFRMVTSASTLIFLYVMLVPLIIYGLLWNRRSEMMHPYIDLVCLYGYSLTIFIPVSLLWIIDLNWFRWTLILVSVGLSGTVLARAIWPAVKNDGNKMIAFGTIFSVVLLHFLLAFTFKEFYFDSMHPTTSLRSSGLNEHDKPEIVAPPMTGVNNGTVGEHVKAPEAPSQIASKPEAESQKIGQKSEETTKHSTQKRDSKEVEESRVEPKIIPIPQKEKEITESIGTTVSKSPIASEDEKVKLVKPDVTEKAEKSEKSDKKVEKTVVVSSTEAPKLVENSPTSTLSQKHPESTDSTKKQ